MLHELIKEFKRGQGETDSEGNRLRGKLTQVYLKRRSRRYTVISEPLLCCFSELRQVGGAWLRAGGLQLQTGDGGASDGLQHHHRRRHHPAGRNQRRAARGERI